MEKLKTTYLGQELKNPVIAGASELTSNMDSIKRIEDAGAGALVIKSLFEEQIQLERYRFDEQLHQYDDLHAEMTTTYPELEYAGAEEHMMWVRKTVEAVDIPVFASLNAVNHDSWVAFAGQLEQTGVQGLELNFYALPDVDEPEAQDIEKEQLKTVAEVVKKVKLPVAVKLSAYYTSIPAMIRKLDKAGVSALVLFNRLFQPDIDVDKEQRTFPFNLSDSSATRLPLRYCGLMHGEVKASLCASGGVMDGKDALKMILAGADTVQVVSTLYRNKISRISEILKDMEEWLDRKGYAGLDQVRGKMSRKSAKDPWSYRRAQYVRMLLKPNPLDFR